jgi:hypothetical protein
VTCGRCCTCMCMRQSAVEERSEGEGSQCVSQTTVPALSTGGGVEVAARMAVLQKSRFLVTELALPDSLCKLQTQTQETTRGESDMMAKPLSGKYQGGLERCRGVGMATLSQLSAAASELTSG